MKETKTERRKIKGKKREEGKREGRAERRKGGREGDMLTYAKFKT